jgi:hypothetical protein
LEGEELSGRLAKALAGCLSGERCLGRKSVTQGKPGEPDPTLGAELGRIEGVLEAEASWREGLAEAAWGRPEMEGIGLRRLSLADVLRRVSPEAWTTGVP